MPSSFVQLRSYHRIWISILAEDASPSADCHQILPFSRLSFSMTVLHLRGPTIMVLLHLVHHALFLLSMTSLDLHLHLSRLKVRLNRLKFDSYRPKFDFEAGDFLGQIIFSGNDFFLLLIQPMDRRIMFGICGRHSVRTRMPKISHSMIGRLKFCQVVSPLFTKDESS